VTKDAEHTGPVRSLIFLEGSVRLYSTQQDQHSVSELTYAFSVVFWLGLLRVELLWP